MRCEFRAWDIISNVMVDGEMIESSTNPDGSSVYYTGLSYGELFVGRFDHKGDWYELSIMQSTGLTDKNGKLIFEGDIVKSVALDNDHHQRGATALCVIVFYQGAFCFCFNGGDSGPQMWPFIVNHTIEIIGNIYETPELLGVK